MTFISYARSPNGTAATTPYSLNLINQSATPWNFYVYQQMPNQPANVFSLAWFCSPFLIVQGAHITFQWTIDYLFVWGGIGAIQPGVVLSAGQVIDADPTSANSTNFSLYPGPNLSPPIAGQPQGSLVIKDASTVPNSTFAVGIGMGEVGTLITAAGPNLSHTFTPATTYWIAAGVLEKVGTILDVATVTQNLEVTFPVNVYDLTFTLNVSNEWTQN